MPGECRKPRILYAEDDRLIAGAIADVLADFGFTVCCAADGIEAVKAAEAFSFDVLLTDLEMPRMNGLELVAALRADTPSLPVVVLTGNPPDGGASAFAGLGSGPFVLLSKPARLDDIEAALAQVMEGGILSA